MFKNLLFLLIDTTIPQNKKLKNIYLLNSPSLCELRIPSYIYMYEETSRRASKICNVDVCTLNTDYNFAH